MKDQNSRRGEGRRILKKRDSLPLDALGDPTQLPTAHMMGETGVPDLLFETPET